jgi:hypothetical protein
MEKEEELSDGGIAHEITLTDNKVRLYKISAASWGNNTIDQSLTKVLNNCFYVIE